jgi:hypothetical protein
VQKNLPSDAAMDRDFQTVYNRVERCVEERYGISVSIGDVADPNTGDFDGERIKLDYDQELDLALFVLLHLFGHTVQWNVSPSLRQLGQDSASAKNPPDAELARIWGYEREATRYGLTLLHAVEAEHLSRWACDWWHADWAFLVHLYRTGERLDARALLRPGEGELLTPLPIPRFSPQRFASRFSF